MSSLKNTKTLVTTALLAALTCIATMVIQIPTPTLGYIHLGDCFVIISGVLLGPVYGPLSAGIGSMFADIFTGYTIYAIPTFIIKGFSAWIAAFLFRKLCQNRTKYFAPLLISGLFCEINVVFGYFINKIVKVMFVAGNYNTETLATGFASALTGILPNTIQGTVGLILSLCLFPILIKVPDIRLSVAQNKAKI